MLGLELRDEFRGSQMTGTQIALTRMVGLGIANEILDITYATADVRTALKSISGRVGRPIAIIGERGRGKSHLLALLHYAFSQPGAVQMRAADWAGEVADPELTELHLPVGFTPNSVVMSDQEFMTLWDPIFARHPRGSFYRGKFEASGVSVPSKSLMMEMLSEQPLAFIVDELQTWYDTLTGPPDGDARQKHAFNFIQILSEIASAEPNLLRFVVSVRNSSSDAYRQIHRDQPVLIDFQGAAARDDRVHLVQRRLFKNHHVIPRPQVAAAVQTYAEERVRLLYPSAAGPGADQLKNEVVDAWPFAPELLDVVEDEILMSAAAQETRDLMRILARMYKARGEAVPILTVADIQIGDDSGAGKELASMVDAVTNMGSRLREVAQRNLQSLMDQGLALPHADEIVSALWVRSLATGPQPGATRPQLHLDITRNAPIDDNVFDDELNSVKGAAFNIHEIGQRLVFKVEENPQAKVLASARNDKLFVDGRDLLFIRSATEQALNPIDAATTHATRLIVLGPRWDTSPWSDVRPDDLPSTWREPILLVLPEWQPDEALALWLRENVSERRNLVRCLTPARGAHSPYEDVEIREGARCALLATEWGRTDRAYQGLVASFQRPLRDALVQRYDNLAVLLHWDFTNPKATRFERHSISTTARGGVVSQVEEFIANNLFEPDLFEEYVLRSAAQRRTAFDVIGSLTEPPARPEDPVIPYLGETGLYERMVAMAAEGKIILNIKGVVYGRLPSDLDTAMALARIRPKVYYTGTHLRDVELGIPSAFPAEQPQHQGPDLGQGATAGQPAGWPPLPGPTGAGWMVGAVGEGAGPAWSVRTLRSSGARKPINLLGEIHGWGIPDDGIQAARLEVRNLTPRQLQDMIKALPSTADAALEIDVKEKQS